MSQAATELSSSKMSVPTEEGPLEIKITTHDFGLSLDDATFGTHTQNAQQASSEEQAETGADASSNIDIGDRTTLLRKNPAHDLAFLMGLHSRLGQESVLLKFKNDIYFDCKLLPLILNFVPEYKCTLCQRNFETKTNVLLRPCACESNQVHKNCLESKALREDTVHRAPQCSLCQQVYAHESRPLSLAEACCSTCLACRRAIQGRKGCACLSGCAFPWRPCAELTFLVILVCAYTGTLWAAAANALDASLKMPVTVTLQAFALLFYGTSLVYARKRWPGMDAAVPCTSLWVVITQMGLTAVAHIISRAVRGYGSVRLADGSEMLLFACSVFATLAMLLRNMHETHEHWPQDNLPYALLVYYARWVACWINSSWPEGFGVAMWCLVLVAYALAAWLFGVHSGWRQTTPANPPFAFVVFEPGNVRDLSVSQQNQWLLLCLLAEQPVFVCFTWVGVGFGRIPRAIDPISADCVYVSIIQGGVVVLLALGLWCYDTLVKLRTVQVVSIRNVV